MPSPVSIFDPVVAAKICEELETGKTLRQICRAHPELPRESTIRKWAAEDREGFYAQYARARDLGLDTLADDLLDISDEATQDAAAARVRVETRKWYLSKLAPKRYSDRLQLEHSVDSDLASRLEAARKRVTDGHEPDEGR